MVTWDWTKNTWECDACGASDNHALANFCARCGALITDKVVSVAAPPSPSEDHRPEEHLVLLRGPDVLLNIFGVALVGKKATGNMTAFPDPLRESSSFDLPRMDKGIAQVRFDQGWVYVLDALGTLFVFPTSALRDGSMARSTKWRRCAENVHKFWSFKDRLIVLGEEGRQIKMGARPVVQNFWREKEMGYEPQKIEPPFEVETLVPLQGRDFLVALVGNNQMALLSDEGVSDPYEGFVDGDPCIGANREGMLRLATTLENREVRVVSFQRDTTQLLPDAIPDLRATALRTIDIDGRDWFVAVASDGIHLIDPLNRNIAASREVFMKPADMCASFGNLVAGFQDDEDPAGSSQMALFRFDRHAISRLHAWSLKPGLKPVTAPAGFGHGLYVLMQERNLTTLCCYALRGDGKV